MNCDSLVQETFNSSDSFVKLPKVLPCIIRHLPQKILGTLQLHIITRALNNSRPVGHNGPKLRGLGDTVTDSNLAIPIHGILPEAVRAYISFLHHILALPLLKRS